MSMIYLIKGYEETHPELPNLYFYGIFGVRGKNSLETHWGQQQKQAFQIESTSQECSRLVANCLVTYLKHCDQNPAMRIWPAVLR